MVCESALLRAAGVIHAFGTRRHGPVAQGEPGEPGESGDWGGLMRRLVNPAAGRGTITPRRAHQVHGADIFIVEDEPKGGMQRMPQADGIATRRPGVAPAIVTADCVPILMAQPGGAVAAVHAGWRGLVAGIIRHGVQALTDRFGVPAEEVLAAIGPSICAERYEVGPEVAHAFEEAGLGQAVIAGEARPHVDLRCAAMLALRQSGLQEAHIEVVAGCTYCDREDFHSYRRDGRAAGRQISVVVA